MNYAQTGAVDGEDIRKSLVNDPDSGYNGMEIEMPEPVAVSPAGIPPGRTNPPGAPGPAPSVGKSLGGGYQPIAPAPGGKKPTPPSKL